MEMAVHMGDRRHPHLATSFLLGRPELPLGRRSDILEDYALEQDENRPKAPWYLPDNDDEKFIHMMEQLYKEPYTIDSTYVNKLVTRLIGTPTDLSRSRKRWSFVYNIKIDPEIIERIKRSRIAYFSDETQALIVRITNMLDQRPLGRKRIAFLEFCLYAVYAATALKTGEDASIKLDRMNYGHLANKSVDLLFAVLSIIVFKKIVKIANQLDADGRDSSGLIKYFGVEIAQGLESMLVGIPKNFYKSHYSHMTGA